MVVGYAGLLDLGFIAFYGLGAYTYALLSSTGHVFPFTGPPRWRSRRGRRRGRAAVGSPSLRLLGDYLAIVTLGFGLVFVAFAEPDGESRTALKTAPNGIVNLDPLHFFGFSLTTVANYYYALLGWLVVVLLVIYRAEPIAFWAGLARHARRPAGGRTRPWACPPSG